MKKDTNKSIFKSKWTVIYAVIMLFIIIWLIFSNLILSNLSGNDIKKIKHTELQSNIDVENIYAVSPNIEQTNSMLDQILLSGWAFYKTDDMEYLTDDRQVDLIFQSEQDAYLVKTELYQRKDVVSAFPNILSDKDTDMLGYVTLFSTLNMKDGIYNLYIQIRENDYNVHLWKSLGQYQKYGSIFSVYEFQSEQIQDWEAVNNASITCIVDSITQKEEKINISGWSYIENFDSNDQEVYVQLESDDGTLTYTTQKRSRPDVAEAFENKLYTLSGYYASIPVNELTAGTYAVKIVVKNGENVGMEQKSTITVAEDGTVTVS